MDEFKDLILLKKSRKKPKVGDVFALKLSNNLFYYGIVTKTDIFNVNPLLKGWNLVNIYNYYSSTLYDTINIEELKNSKLLLPPIVTNHKGWYDGYFYTIASFPISQKELVIDYGFWDSIREKYRDEEGTEINHIPKYIAGYGLVSYGGIGRAIHRVLNNESHQL